MRRDLTNLKQNQEYLIKQIEDKENTAPTKGLSNAYASNHKPLSSQLSTSSKLSSNSIARPTMNGTRKTDRSIAELPDTNKTDPNVVRIRSRVLKILQEHDPTKVDKIDVVMSKFEGRETELLEKMISRYENDKESVASAVESGSMTGEERPKSRQDLALERHMARMKRKKAMAGQDPK